MKWWKVLTITSFIALGATLFWRTSYIDISNEKKSWTVYEFDQNSEDVKVVSRKPDKTELKTIHAPEKEKKRAPASVDLPKFKGRKIYGLNNNVKNDLTSLEFTNKVKRDWRKNLTKNLIRFHEKDTKVYLKEELSLIKMRNGKGRYVEQVVITYLRSGNEQNSFRALIDSETGKIINTWDKTRHDKVNNMFKRKPVLVPSGSL